MATRILITREPSHDAPNAASMFVARFEGSPHIIARTQRAYATRARLRFMPVSPDVHVIYNGTSI